MYYPQTAPTMRTPAPSYLKGRPVASLEEARAQSIDFDGSVFYFPDVANKRIYTKQINLDGTASLCMYEMKEIPAPPSANNFITREEFEAVITQLKNSLTPAEEVSPKAPASVPTANFTF